MTVTLTDGRKFIAEVKGADEFSDLAVLQIDKSIGTDQGPLPAAKLGNSQDLQVRLIGWRQSCFAIESIVLEHTIIIVGLSL